MIIAPGIEQAALPVLATKKNVRVLECANWTDEPAATLDFKRVNGGLLVQDRDMGKITEQELKVVTQRAPTARELKDLLFAWRIGKFVKSNGLWITI